MAKARILVVEDEVIIGMDLKVQLESLGYEVTSLATSADEALSAVNQDPPDIVMMDIVLKGGVDGIECAEKMRQQHDIPVIFTTAYADMERLNKVKLVLPFGYLLKPYNERNLQVTLEMALYTAKAHAERKRAEQALRESENRYRELVENANTIIIKMTTEGAVVFFNEFAQKFFGFSEAEILGHNVIGVIVPRTESTGRDLSGIVQEALRDPQRFGEFENENILKNGERVWINWRNKPLYNESGEVTGLLSIGTDVTERVKAERELNETRDILKKAFDTVHAGVAITREKDGVILEVNPAQCKMTGFSREELLGKTVWDLGILTREQRDCFVSEVRMRGSLHNQEIVLQSKREGPRRVLVSIARIKIREEPCLLMTTVDITDCKQPTNIKEK